MQNENENYKEINTNLFACMHAYGSVCGFVLFLLVYTCTCTLYVQIRSQLAMSIDYVISILLTSFNLISFAFESSFCTTSSIINGLLYIILLLAEKK